MLAIGSSALSFAAGVSAGAPAANMNGAFLVATGSSKQGGDPVVSFPDSYASKGHEYFDVWAPEIATHYGENFWTSQGNQPIPDHIIERFKGKTMAITGYEQDQVMVTPTGKPGVNPEKDVSVPINWAYNHHYMAWMTGRHSEMKYLAHPDPTDTSYHGGPAHWVAVDKPSAALRSDTSIPTSQMFSEGNGGESRKSFHGYPKGYAQLIDSPEEWHITPMQIDTRNRDCGVTPADVHRCVAFTPSLEPKQARYGRKVGASNYSGVLECPCNSRFGGDPIFYPSAQTKKVAHLYDVLGSGACAAGRAIASPEACYAAAVGLGLDPSALTNATAADPTRPAACYFVARPGGKVAVTFNTGGKAACAPGTLRTGVTAAPIGVTFNLTLDSAPAGGLATLTLTGPADAWFAAGIGASVMANAPYTVVANSSGVFERQIGTCGSEAEHCAGDDLPSSLTLVSNTVVGGKRTVVATRPFKGKSAKHHTFDPTKDAALPFITAYGTSQAFGYHKDHMATSLVLLAPEGEATCVCDGGTEGSLCGYNGTGCSRLAKSCRSPWDGVAGHSGGDLLAQRNPTCNGAQYSGGLSCCGHRRIMLDEDQDPGTTLLRYHMKFRFWFQEYVPPTNASKAPSHYDLPRYYYQTEANAGEYDIPPAFRREGDPPIVGYPEVPVSKAGDLHLTPGTTCAGACPDGPDCDCVHTITSHWSMPGSSMMYAGGHCHAPSCIGIELWKNDTGVPELLCNQTSRYGQGNVKADKFDEAGYIVLPPCLWGNASQGLQPPVYLPAGTPVFSVKRNRNTHAGHFGEMASWQMRGVPFDPSKAPQPTAS